MSSYKHYNGGVFELHMTTPQLEPTETWKGSRRVYRLHERFAVRISYPEGNMNLTVPKGFETDLASFPLVLQLLLGNRDNYLEESIIHDFLYREDIQVFFANAMMRVVMEKLHRSLWRRLLVYYGLMFFGYQQPHFRWIINLYKKVRNKNEQLIKPQGPDRSNQSPVVADPAVRTDPGGPRPL